jgi:transcription antitermination factor NusG
MKKWIAIYTKSHHEKTTASALEEKGYAVYLPLIRQKRKWSDRTKWVDAPLFKSYMFVQCEIKQGLFILQTPGVVSIVKFSGQIAVVPSETILSLRMMIEGGFIPEPIDYFIKGDLVEVKEGPMKGVTGEVIRVDKHDRLLLRIDAIQHSVSIQINRGFLKTLK